MRSDDRFYFLLAAFAMSASLVYTVFFHVLPELDARHNYLYAHCTVTGHGHWEKYETVYGIKERVVVPVEVHIGTIEGALDWDGVDPLNSTDVYHQGIGRDKPSGWEYFTKEEKQDYLRTYKPGQEYECWMRPGSGTNEVVFHKRAISFRLIPELIFCAIVLFLCVATGVCMVSVRPVAAVPLGANVLRRPRRPRPCSHPCSHQRLLAVPCCAAARRHLACSQSRGAHQGMADILRSLIGLPPADELDEDDEDMRNVATEKYGDYGSVAVGSGGPVVYRQFSQGYGDREGDREWV